MYRQCVVGIYDSLKDARPALESLEKEEYSQDDVSLVTTSVDREVENPEMLEYGDASGERAATGAGVGALVGALVGSPLLIVPGIGPLLMAGPIATGGVVGGLVGAMTGWGVEPDNVQSYEERIKQGAVLIFVQGPPDRVARAHEILSDTPAQEVRLHAKTSADSPEIDDRPGTE